MLPAGPSGLFPKPIKPGAKDETKRLDIWEFAGTLVAKAMLDGRLLDLPLAPCFWDWIRGTRPLTLHDLAGVYPEVARVLQQFQLIRVLRDGGERDPAKLLYQSAPGQPACALADLGFSMTLIRHDDWELVPNGNDQDLTLDNLHLYVDATLDALMGSGVASFFLAYSFFLAPHTPRRCSRCATPSVVAGVACSPGLRSTC